MRPALGGVSGAPVVVGAGLAGLVTALGLAPQPCVVLSAGPLGEAGDAAAPASGWAQGGFAAALGPADSPRRHAADTLAAGAGLCDPATVAAVTAAAPAAVEWLAGLGAAFDRAPDGSLRLGLEGAHTRHRIVHAGGDASGAEILRAVVAAVRGTPSVTVVERARAHGVLLAADGSVRGVQVALEGRELTLATDRVVLATGGAGALWRHTTNPAGAVGAGLALAARAGAVLRDLEMMQFHPTALDVGLDPMPLVSEAVRGQGAVLVRADGSPLTDPLAARDVVARAVGAELAAGGRVYLDTRDVPGRRVADKFPRLAAACAAAGLDPAVDLVPVRPAAHYHCGGVLVDRAGRSTVPGLWAVGEVASTGLHGANRLASNSLLEAVVCGGWVAADVASVAASPAAPATLLAPRPADGDGTAPPEPARDLPEVRDLMSEHVGLVRTGTGVRTALDRLLRVDPVLLDDARLVAALVAHSALARTESRGGHRRGDHPATSAAAHHTLVTLDDLQVGPALARRSA